MIAAVSVKILTVIGISKEQMPSFAHAVRTVSPSYSFPADNRIEEKSREEREYINGKDDSGFR